MSANEYGPASSVSGTARYTNDEYAGWNAIANVGPSSTPVKMNR
jgi:hypothetical protein